MAEIAGLVVGGIPLALWVLDKYAEPYETFHRYRAAIEDLQTDLNLQRHLLSRTLSNIGLSDDASDEDIRECFETKYPSISRDLMSIMERMGGATADLLKTLDVDATAKPEQLADRAQWQWRRVKHSFTTKKWKGLIDNLTRWNKDLEKALEKTEVPAQDDTRKVQDLKRRFNIKRSDAIRQCLASFHRALEYGFRCGCSTPHQAAIDLDWASYESDSARTLSVAVSYESTSQGQALGSWCKLGITSETVVEAPDPTPEPLAPPSPTPLKRAQPLTPSPSTESEVPSRSSSFRSRVVHFKLGRSLSQTASAPVSPVATLSSPRRSVSDAAPAAPAPTSSHITSLCAALCTEGNPWPLKRFLKDPGDDKSRHYSLHHNSVDSPHIIRAVPLKSLLSSRAQKSQRRNPYLVLTAKQRYGIAATIAWSVLHLAHSPWLNEREWDQKQMSIFVERTQTGREKFSTHPSASYIFTAPQPRQQEGESTDILDNIVNQLVPNRVILALGVLLIELCISEPISKPRGESGEAVSTLDDYQSALCRLDEVYREAGNSYGHAAERCVKCMFQGQAMERDFDFSTFRKEFYDAVVAPVQATYLAFNG